MFNKTIYDKDTTDIIANKISSISEYLEAINYFNGEFIMGNLYRGQRKIEFSKSLENKSNSVINESKNSPPDSFINSGKMGSFILKLLSLCELMEENDPAYNTPIAITHYAFDKRMINQECMFTYQNNIYKEFKPHNKGNYKKITIANPYKIKNELITLGYNESKIYPSISGLANSLVHNHANDFYRWS